MKKTGLILRRALSFLMESRFAGNLMFLLLVAALYFLVRRTGVSIGSFDTGELTADLLIGSLAFVILAYLNRFAFWTLLTSSYKLKAALTSASRAFFLSLLGRYVPGKAGLFLLRLRAYSGNTRRKVGAALLTEYLATTLAACFLVTAGTLFVPVENIVVTRILPVSGMIVFSCLIHPGVLRRVINRLLRFLGKDPLEIFPRTRILVAITFGYVLTGMLHGLALFLLIRNLGNAGWNMYPVVTGAYYMAGLVGMFAFFAPGGIGIREGVAFLILPQFIETEPVLLSVALMRLIMVSAELLLAGVSAGFYALSAKGEGSDEK